MIRATSLGAVTFDTNTLFIQEQYNSNNVMGEVAMSSAGTHIAYEATIHTPYITLDSKEHGIITEAQRAALETMWATLDTTYTLTYDDTTTQEVRMTHEKQLVFTPLFEGSCQFRAIIPLAAV